MTAGSEVAQPAFCPFCARIAGSLTVVATAPPGIPAGCICSYTNHPEGGGRLLRNGPLTSCPADHAGVDAGKHPDLTAGPER